MNITLPTPWGGLPIIADPVSAPVSTPIASPIASAPTSPIGQTLNFGANILNDAAAWMTDNSIDIFFKGLAVCGALTLLWFMPATRKFAGWAALILLFILMVGSSQENGAQLAPASSTLPLPTQIGTPVPPADGSGGGGSSSGGGSSWLSYIGDAINIASLFGL